MKKLNKLSTLSIGAALAALELVVAPLAQAASTYTFTGTSGTINWSSGTSWSAIPVSGSDNTLTFGNGTSLAASAAVVANNDIASPPFKHNALNLTYAGPASGTAPTVTIQGNQLEFDTSSGSVAPTMNFTTTGTVKPTVTISAPILFANTAAIATTTDAILSGTLSGAGGFTKSGGGTLRITQNSASWTGSVGLSAGILQIGNNGGFGSLGSGTITLSGSGSFNVARAANSFNLDNTITGSTSGSVNFYLNNSATPTAFAVTLTKANNYTAATTLQPFANSSVGTPTLKNGIDNALSTTTAFTINTVSGATAVMTYDLAGFDQTIASLTSGSGVTTANGIVTDSGAAKTLTISSSSGSTTYAGLISGAIALTKSGASTQILSGGNSYSGLTTVNGGVLQINHASALGSTAVGTTVNGSDGSVNFLGTVLDLNGVAVGSGESLTLDCGTTANNRVTLRSVTGTSSSWAGSVVFAGDKLAQLQTGNASAQLAISGSITGPSYAGTLNLRGAGIGTLSGGITLNSANNIQVLDGGTWNINTSGNAWGSTTVANGSLVTGAANALPGAQFITLGSSTTSGTLKLNGFDQTMGGLAISGTGTANKVVNGSSTASTLTVSHASNNSTFPGVLGGSGTDENNFGLTKSGNAILTLSGTNTYAGSTIVSVGTLALSGGALITNSASIVVASNAIFNVSTLSSAFTLAQSLSSQTLSNSAPGAIINGTNNCSAGTVSLVYDGVNPSFTITNGGMTLSASTTFKVSNTGAALSPGTYRIISKATAGNVGLVAGTVPSSVTVVGGPGAGTPALSIVNGELYLTVGAASTVTLTGSSFTYNGSAQTPSISFSGSTGAKTTNYLGTLLSYNSVNPPTNAGNYYVSNTVAADANYFGATNSLAFTIGAKAASVTANPQTKTYGDVNPTLTATVAGTVNGDVLNYTLATDATQFSSVGVSNITVTLGSNPNYSVSATNSTLTINQASIFVGASSTKNPSGYTDSVSYIATLPADATGSVVFSSTNGPISTNSVSGVTTTSLSITNLPRGTNLITVAYLGDGNYVGSTNTLNQIVTNHPPVASVMTVNRTAGLALIISLSDVATNWTDNPDGDQVSLTGVTMQSTNGINLFPLNWSTNLDGTIVTSNAYAFIGYTNSPNVADQITYGISDGHGGTNLGYISIVIQGSVTGTNSITGHDFSSPYSNTVTAYGIPYFYYTLERSTNLTSPVWVDVSTNQAATNGVINAVDTFWDLGGVKPSPSAFYQLKWQP